MDDVIFGYIKIMEAKDAKEVRESFSKTDEYKEAKSKQAWVDEERKKDSNAGGNVYFSDERPIDAAYQRYKINNGYNIMLLNPNDFNILKWKNKLEEPLKRNNDDLIIFPYFKSKDGEGSFKEPEEGNDSLICDESVISAKLIYKDFINLWADPLIKEINDFLSKEVQYILYKKEFFLINIPYIIGRNPIFHKTIKDNYENSWNVKIKNNCLTLRVKDDYKYMCL